MLKNVTEVKVVNMNFLTCVYGYRFYLYEYIGLERGNMNQAVLNAKQEMVSEISSKIKESQSTVVVEYRGLSVAEVTEYQQEN